MVTGNDISSDFLRHLTPLIWEAGPLNRKISTVPDLSQRMKQMLKYRDPK